MLIPLSDARGQAKRLPAWLTREPVRFGAVLVIFINSVIAVAVSFGWLTIDASRVSLLYLVVIAGVVLHFGEAVRGRVSPTGNGPRGSDAKEVEMD